MLYGPDVLSVRDDDLLGAIKDEEPSFLVEVSNISAINARESVGATVQYREASQHRLGAGKSENTNV